MAHSILCHTVFLLLLISTCDGWRPHRFGHSEKQRKNGDTKQQKSVKFPQVKKWCDTTDIQQVIQVTGCQPKTIRNKACVGQCNSHHFPVPSCRKPGIPNLRTGKYNVHIGGSKTLAYCDMQKNSNGWTLIARFSNNDTKNWMRDDGHWWYDQRSPQGHTTNPATNTDMISPAFWSVTGTEFRITRSDDPTHTALLVTTGGCLGGQTFRSKLTSYGNFRNSAVWASDRCLGSCSVQYGGRYQSTHGFDQVFCDGRIQSRYKIGFWCDWDSGVGSVMMIGGGGSGCARADHGIGITEADEASFKEKSGSETEYDFGYEAQTSTNPSSSYSLNLWVR